MNFPEKAIGLLIVHCPLYEPAVIKVQQGSEPVLSNGEQANISRISVLEGEDNVSDEDGDLSFAQKALKRRRLRNNTLKPAYYGTRCVLRTPDSHFKPPPTALTKSEVGQNER